MIKHKFFLRLAFNLAEKNLGKTRNNPSVGCVIVKNNSVLSSGVTSINGRPHAEFNALNKNLNFNGSDMYVTLEPCTHYGLTPPCTQIIKKNKIKNVFYSFKDPDRRTFGKAKKDLLNSAINVKRIEIDKNKFYKSYFLNKIKEFPFIDAKIAISKDFNTISKKSKRITNNRSRNVSHLLRSRYDCIISTSKTINKDNALLNCRINGLKKNQPDLIIIDRDLKLKKNLSLFKMKITRKTYIFTTRINNRKKINFFKNNKCKIINVDSLKSKKDFLNLFSIIFKIGKRRILVEAGLTFLKKLLSLKLINDLFIFQSQKNLKQSGYNNISSKYLRKYKLRKPVNVNLNGDKLFKIKV